MTIEQHRKLTANWTRYPDITPDDPRRERTCSIEGCWIWPDGTDDVCWHHCQSLRQPTCLTDGCDAPPCSIVGHCKDHRPEVQPLGHDDYHLDLRPVRKSKPRPVPVPVRPKPRVESDLPIPPPVLPEYEWSRQLTRTKLAYDTTEIDLLWRDYDRACELMDQVNAARCFDVWDKGEFAAYIRVNHLYVWMVQTTMQIVYRRMCNERQMAGIYGPSKAESDLAKLISDFYRRD